MPKRVERGSGEPGGGGPVAAFDETFGVEHLTEGPFDVHVELVGDLEAGRPGRRGHHVGGQAGLNQNPPGPRHHLAGHSFPTVWVRLGPEELDEFFAQQRPGALQHQEGEDQRRLGTPNLDWLTAGGLDHRPTEKTDLHRGVPHLVRPPTRATLGLAPGESGPPASPPAARRPAAPSGSSRNKPATHGRGAYRDGVLTDVIVLNGGSSSGK